MCENVIFKQDPVPAQANEDFIRLTARHFASLLPPTGARQHPYRRCKVCRVRRNIRRETKYFCAKCPSQPALCVDGCFEMYHTLPDI